VRQEVVLPTLLEALGHRQRIRDGHCTPFEKGEDSEED
jgi:hypothetical protein